MNISEALLLYLLTAPFYWVHGNRNSDGEMKSIGFNYLAVNFYNMKLGNGCYKMNQVRFGESIFLKIGSHTIQSSFTHSLPDNYSESESEPDPAGTPTATSSKPGLS
jgi:hypothetical protein